MGQTHIYLDHAATTPLHPEVLGIMLPYFGYHYGNPNSAYSLADRSRRAVEHARAQVAALTNAHAGEIVFTAGGTEANNLAIQGSARALKARGRHIITSAIEHHSVLKACTALEDQGFRVSYLGVDHHGRVDPQAVRQALCPDTILISIMHVNNETGVMQPVPEISSLARAHGAVFHTDASQSAGKIPLDVHDLGADLVSLTSHKLYGPKGCGALYVRQGTELLPLMQGGDQEHGLRPGTENVPGIVGFGMACEVAGRDLAHNLAHIRNLCELLEGLLRARVPGLSVNAPPEKGIPHILSVAIEGLEGASLVAALDARNIYTSSGAACTTYRIEPSHVLSAMNLGAERSYGTVRISLGWENTPRQMRRVADAVREAASRLRALAKANPLEIGAITFDSVTAVRQARKVLLGTPYPFALGATPLHLRQSAGSQVSVLHAVEDQSALTALLGQAGIAIAGSHRIRGVHAPARGLQLKEKERAFWDKVVRVKKEHS